MNRLILLILFVSCFSAPAIGKGLFEEAVEGAESSDEGKKESTSSFISTFSFELNGYIRGTTYLGKVMDESDAELKNGYGEAALKLRMRSGDYGAAFSELRLRQIYRDGQHFTEFDVREAYVDVYVGPLDFRVGHQIIAWGRADGFNPTDNLTPKNMRTRSPNEDDMRIGNLAVNISLSVDEFKAEMVWVPVYALSQFPDFELPGELSLDDPYLPDDLENGTGAIRLHYLGVDFEGSISYTFGNALFPGIEFTDLSLVDYEPVVSVRMHPFQQHVAGLDFASVVGDLGLRGEVAFRWPIDYEEDEYRPLPDLQYILGLDYQLGDFFFIVQYIGRYVFEWTYIDESMPESLPTLDQIMDLIQAKTRMVHGQSKEVSHTVFARIQWTTLNETLMLELVGQVNISTEEWMLRFKTTYDIADALEFALGGELFMGPDNTLYGTIDEVQSAGFAELKASF